MSATPETSRTATVWPTAYAVAQVCMTRPTARFDDVMAFYRDALGLPVLYQFEGDGGVKGGMVGLPDATHHLEFIQTHATADCKPPNGLHTLVLHIPSRAEVERLASALAARGHPAVEPANPYWIGRAVVVEDPDGWPVVLAIGTGLSPAR